MPNFIVMTWNVENLFFPGTHEDALDQPTFSNKIKLITRTISLLDPDVIAFQELGVEDSLKAIQQGVGAGTYPARRISTRPDKRGIRVGFLSKHPLDEDEPEDFGDFPEDLPALDIQGVNDQGDAVQINQMGRGALRVRVTVHGMTIDLITAHLKSKLLTFPGGLFSTQDENLRAQIAAIALMRRTAEATTIRIRANALLDDPNLPRGLIVLGDLNDGPNAATSQILLGPSGSEIKTKGFDRPDQGDPDRLFNVAPLIPEERRFSRIHRGRGELLDQIMASEELFPRDNGQRRLPMVDSHINFVDNIASVVDNPNARLGEIEPDHAPVTAIFDIP